MTPPKPKRPRRQRKPTGKPGAEPAVVRGFSIDSNGRPQWKARTPAAEVLAALAIGSTWEGAARYARLHPTTPKTWNARGAQLCANLPDFAAYRDTNPDEQSLALVAFHIEAEAARVTPVAGALDAIDRARRAGDWKAAAHMLRVLPQAKDFRPDPRVELTGPEGAPITVSVADEARSKLEAMADRLARNAPPDRDE